MNLLYTFFYYCQFLALYLVYRCTMLLTCDLKHRYALVKMMGCTVIALFLQFTAMYSVSEPGFRATKF